MSYIDNVLDSSSVQLYLESISVDEDRFSKLLGEILTKDFEIIKETLNQYYSTDLNDIYESIANIIASDIIIVFDNICSIMNSSLTLEEKNSIIYEEIDEDQPEKHTGKKALLAAAIGGTGGYHLSKKVLENPDIARKLRDSVDKDTPGFGSATDELADKLPKGVVKDILQSDHSKSVDYAVDSIKDMSHLGTAAGGALAGAGLYGAYRLTKAGYKALKRAFNNNNNRE
jgi:hypothetical protein